VTKRTARASPPDLRREAYPALTDFLAGYLHEDFVVIHGSVEGAAAAFCADANADERQRVVGELEALLRATTSHSSNRLRRFVVEGLGSGWTPSSRGDLLALRDALGRAR